MGEVLQSNLCSTGSVFDGYIRRAAPAVADNKNAVDGADQYDWTDENFIYLSSR